MVDADAVAGHSFKLCTIFVLSVVSEDSETNSAQPDLPDRLRVRRWKRVSMSATLIQPAPGYYYQVPGDEMGPSNGKSETAVPTSLQRSVSTRTSRIKMLLSMVGPCFRMRSGGSLC